MSYVGKINSDNFSHPVSSSLYGECGVTANTAEKSVNGGNLGDFDALINGVTIQVKFTYSNTADNPTLNVNGTGAKNIYTNGTNRPGKTNLTSWPAGAVVTFTYDGEAWRMHDVGLNSSTGLSDLFSLIYPIGSIYMATNSVSPATLFGGNWEQIENRFLLCAGSLYPPGSSGGSAQVTLGTENLPSHTHEVGAHTHGLSSIKAWINSHVHGYSVSADATGGTAITADQMPAHTHGSASLSGNAYFRMSGTSDANLITSADGICSVSYVDWDGNHDASSAESKSNYKRNVLTIDATHTHTSNGGGQAHTHAITKSNANTSAATAWIGDSTDACDTFNTGSVGSGTAVNIMPPYLAVYVWKRTA